MSKSREPLQGGTELVNGMKIFGGTPEQIAAITRRDSFIRKYAEGKGWDVNNLSLDQIFEIRRQEGWKNPL